MLLNTTKSQKVITFGKRLGDVTYTIACYCTVRLTMLLYTVQSKQLPKHASGDKSHQ